MPRGSPIPLEGSPNSRRVSKWKTAVQLLSYSCCIVSYGSYMVCYVLVGVISNGFCMVFLWCLVVCSIIDIGSLGIFVVCSIIGIGSLGIFVFCSIIGHRVSWDFRFFPLQA